MKAMWDERYKSKAYAYGTAPNAYFEYTFKKYALNGRVLFPAEGEGRNAVFAAKNGIDAVAFDISVEGKHKATQLAASENVSVQYHVGEFLDMQFEPSSFDAAVMVYSHFPPAIRTAYHQKISDLVKPGGLIILEGFSTGHLPYRESNPEVGGPNNIEMLFSKENIAKDFEAFEVVELEEVEIELHEGAFHNGVGKVIRFVGKKRR
jgi:SAM-dependent methyltransferase